ncbi:acyl carrier protein [Lampropedia puyangensis]|uniref:Acyl carrier protein n=1 Tax=Lampropedia puyangensis TaxID=1330072 RepID=A0A4S8F3J4_9BURK|nr:acyl carrier protein [Lampropedia puyangensis]THU01948.1 acyl carrier protein [Lampropedia puyangensis]
MSHPQLPTIQRIISESLLIPADRIALENPIAGLHNIDSLSFEMIIVAMEAESGKSIEPENLMPLKTVGDLADLLNKLKQTS